jgi:flagellar M-ring protein FliF
MGFSKDRGDSVNVVNAPFSQPDFGTQEAVPPWKQPDLIALGREVGKAMLFLLLALIVVFGAVRPALRSLGTRAVAADGKEGDGEDDDGEAQVAISGAAPALAAPESPMTTSLNGMRLLAKSDPASVANVVKAWVGEGK